MKMIIVEDFVLKSNNGYIEQEKHLEKTAHLYSISMPTIKSLLSRFLSILIYLGELDNLVEKN